MSPASPRYTTFAEFWPFYLSEHSKAGTRVLHVLGTSLLIPFLIKAILDTSLFYLSGGVISAYGCAWIGHFFIEKNRPATFQYPLFSLMGDFKMYALLMTGRLRFSAPAG